MAAQAPSYNQAPPATVYTGHPAMPFANSASLPVNPLAVAAPSVPLMTQLPNVPLPPFIQAYNPNTQAVPALPASNTTTAQSVPLQTLPEVPPPHLVAPYLYLQLPKTGPSYLQQAAAGQTPQNSQNLMSRQAAFPAQQPGALPQPMAAPPQAPPIPPPVPPAPPAPAPTPPPPQTKGPETPSASLSGGALSDEIIQSLNKRLNDTDSGVRSGAAIDLFKILDKDPALADDPVYKPYVDAFIEKIMKDPNAAVRTAGELFFQTGKVKAPTEKTKQILKQLSQTDSITGEKNVASQILESIASGRLSTASAEPKKKDVTATASAATTPSTPQTPATEAPAGNIANPATPAASMTTQQPIAPTVNPMGGLPAQAVNPTMLTPTGGMPTGNPNAAYASGFPTAPTAAVTPGYHVSPNAGGIPMGPAMPGGQLNVVSAAPQYPYAPGNTQGMNFNAMMSNPALAMAQPGQRFNVREGV